MANAERPVVLGVDCGTQGVRVIAADRAGRIVGNARSEHVTRYLPGGGAEQDPCDWWTGLISAVRALGEHGLDLTGVSGIAVTSTSSTVVFADESGEPVAPALLWQDVRAVEEAQLIAATEHAALAICPDGVSPEWGPPKSLWLKRHRPEAWARTAHICEAGDWLVRRLSGCWVMNAAAATTAWFFDGQTWTWPESLFEASDLTELVARVPAKVAPLTETIGPLTADAARDLGLEAGIPVVEGGIDSVSAMIASGVTGPGMTALITGSSNVVLSLTDRPVRAAGVWGSYHAAAVPGLDLVVGLHNAGSVTTWLTRDVLGGADYASMSAAAREVPAGSGGLIVLPDFQGNRTPYTEPLARGAIWGLRLEHGPAHLFRATLEGIACATRLAIEAITDAGVGIDDLRICGGATRDPLAMQILADVLGREIRLVEHPDASALGAAISASVALGWFGSLGEAATALSPIREVVRPISANRAVYDDQFGRFRDTYPALLPLMRRTR